MNKVIIVGGGAAGLFAAMYAMKGGARAVLLERNEKLGKKIYITGKGRCNLTNACEKDPFMRHILRNPRFMFASLALLDNNKLMDLIESLGVPLKVERGDRVFPESDKASDITRTLEREIKRLGADIRLNSRVEGLLIEDGEVRGVRVNGKDEYADAVILATGGLSYPATGSTGDGHAFAREAGLAVTPLFPALVPIETNEDWCYQLSGLSLKNVTLRAYSAKKRIYSEQGEMLFTHFGISGPLVLTLSSLLPEDTSDIRLSIDLKPALDDGTLEKRLVREVTGNPRRSVNNMLDTLEPHSLSQALLEIAGIDGNKPSSALTAQERTRLRLLIKDVPLTIKKLRGFDEAIITRGGVSVKEVNPSTLEARRIKRLYIAGELLDVDCLTGGFNLQTAFSTGALAGKSAAARENE